MKISIIIPSYNCENYIQECITSCLNQDYNNYELIVVDNESEDNTVEKIKEIHNSNNFIFTTAENIYPRCWDECLDIAKNILTGDYYTIVGSDDKIKSNYISNNVKHIKELKADFLQSSNQWYTNALQEGHENTLVTFDYSNIDELKSKLLTGCHINTPTVFYNSKIMKSGELITNPLKYSGAGDYDLYCQMVDKGYYIHNTKTWLGYMYRMHSNQATWKMQKDEIKYDKLIQKKWRYKWTS